MFETVEALVRDIMEREPKTRSNDKLLVCYVYEALGVNTRFTSFAEVMTLTGLPSTETITRCRRKIQEHGEMCADRVTNAIRLKKRNEAEKYAFDKR